MNLYAYQMFEAMQLALAPARAFSDATRLALRNPINPMSHTTLGRNMAAGAELFERMTRRYGKPAFGLDSTTVKGAKIGIEEEVVWAKPYCRLLRFRRSDAATLPRLLIVAPISGHYATLLRGTVEAFLPHYDVHITDWTDARMVPLALGKFDLDDYIDYLVEIMQLLHAASDGLPVHTLGVCQPAVPLIAAIALMEKAGDPASPASTILMGGPIDTRRSPTAVNLLAQKRGVNWFRQNCLVRVPFPYPGVGREVYPGFLQLSGFMAMNFNRHVNAHVEMFNHLVEGDGDSAEKHREFYDEYLAVMDLDADYYMQTIETVFVAHALPNGTMRHRGAPVDLAAIERTALMTVEGENDDISGIGQTQAAQDLCVNIPANRKMNYVQPNVGHYGVFNGSRFRREIVPRIVEFAKAAAPAAKSPRAKNVR